MASPPGRTRRELLFGFTDRLLQEQRERALPPEQRATRSERPPESRLVIPAGSDAAVMALLGPFQEGAFIGGCFLESVVVGDARVDYFFVGREGRVQITLLHRDAAAELPGQRPVQRTTSLQIFVGGDAPEATRRTVAHGVASQVAARDQGQLWRPASSTG